MNVELYLMSRKGTIDSPRVVRDRDREGERGGKIPEASARAKVSSSNVPTR